MPSSVLLDPRRGAALLLSAVLCGVAACVPKQDLDEYSQSAPGAGGAAGGAGSPAGGAGGVSPRADSGAGASPAQPDGGGGSAEPPSPPGGSGGGTRDGGVVQPRIDAGSTPDAALAACAAGELLGPDGHCHFLQATSVSWQAARDACRARGVGWDLTSVRSAAEGAFLGDALVAEAWIGATDAAEEGTWVWVFEDEPFWAGGSMGAPVADAYTNWNTTEPNGAATTNCARALPRQAMSTNPGALWADLGCAEERGAVCERHTAAGS